MPSLLSDSAVRLGIGMRRTWEPATNPSLRHLAIENATKRKQCDGSCLIVFVFFVFFRLRLGSLLRRMKI